MVVENKFILLLPPKTASNSLKALLRLAGQKFLEPHPNFNKPNLHLFLSEIKEGYNITDIDSYKIIQILRNPYDRMCSSYFHINRIIHPFSSKISFNNYDFRRFLEHLNDCYGAENFLECLFGDLEPIDKLITSKQSWGGTRLFENQIDWNDTEAEVKYFYLENLSKNTEELSSYLNLDLPKLPTLNIGPKKSYDEMLSTENKKIIERVYQKDFNSFY